MFSQFLRRPALAIVISIIILFLGGLSIKTLPISQFPNVAPPSVVVTLAYPGASANVLVDSVLVILEQAINGVADMRYMVSAGTSAGEATILIIFEPGTDPNVARLERAKPHPNREATAPADRGAGGHHRPPVHDEHADVREHLQHGSGPQPGFPLQLRLRQRRARDQAGPRHRQRQDSRQPRVCHAGLAESRPHAGLQRLLRRRHEGARENRA